MDVFKDYINKTLFEVNPKVGCTGILQALELRYMEKAMNRRCIGSSIVL